MTVQTQAMMNGVDVDRLIETIENIKANPSLGESHFRAKNRWIIGGMNRSTIQDFYVAGGEDMSRSKPFVFDNDEPPVLLGENRGANPVEYVLHGLAGCVTTTFVYYAASQGIEIESIESSLEGDIDLRGMLGIAPVPSGYQAIRFKMRVKTNAPEEKVRELFNMVSKRSPVFGTVSSPVPVTFDFKQDA